VGSDPSSSNPPPSGVLLMHGIGTAGSGRILALIVLGDRRAHLPDGACVVTGQGRPVSGFRPRPRSRAAPWNASADLLSKACRLRVDPAAD
jgi:hypothetical protein